jgi:ADP-ribosylation factor-like protein 3
MRITYWDVGYGPKLWPLYRHHFQICDCIIFVLDSISFLEEYDSIQREIKCLCTDDKLVNRPILVFANKMDSLDSIPCGDIREMLSEDLKDRTYYIQACSAETGEGLGVGLKWLFDNLKINNIPPWLTALGLEEYEGRNARGPMLK